MSVDRMQSFSKRNILVITWNYPPKVGGIERLLYQLVHNISGYAHLDIIYPNNNNGDRSIYFRQLSFLLFIIRSIFSGFIKLIKEEYDILLSGNLLVAFPCILISLFARTPVVAMVHGTDLLFENVVYQRVVRWILFRCDHVIANSEMTKDEVLLRGVNPQKVTVINPGIDFHEFQSAPTINVKEKYGFGDGKIVLSVGRLTEGKGLVEFVHYSFPEIIRQYPEIELVIVGDNPNQALYKSSDVRSSLEEIALELGLMSNITFTGWVTDVNEIINFYRVCDVFILPVVGNEGFGKVVIEANAVGKPVVANKVGGVTDALEHGINGYLIEKGNWDAFADAVISILKDEEVRNYFRSRCQEIAKNKFDWGILVNKYIAVFESYIVT